MSSEFSEGPDEKLKPLVIEHYGERYFALYEGEDLGLCHCLQEGGAGS